MTTTADIVALFDLWNGALKTQDSRQVTALYAEDGILLPTLSNQVRHNHEEINDYFEFFCGLKPVATMVESNVTIDGDFATNSGIYAFELDAEDGTRVDVRVRFTFSYRRTDASRLGGAGWEIISHHSSAFPEDN